MRKGGWVNYRCSQLRAKKSGQRDASATANVVVLILPTKSWIESGYVRHKNKILRSQAVFLQMPLVVFKRARDVGVLENVEDPIIRENVVACELVVGRDVEEEVGRSLVGV